MITFGWIGAVQKAFAPEPLRSVAVADDESHRVDPAFKGNLVRHPREGVDSLYDLANDAFIRYADRPCMGVREFLGMKTEKIKHFGGIHWRTFEQVGVASHKFGAALRAEGLVPAPTTTTLNKITTHCAIAIFENTCPEWMIAAMGTFTQSLIVTTIYATLGLDAVVDAVNDCNIKAIVCNKTNVATLTKVIGKMPCLKVIIYTNDNIAPGDTTLIPTAPKGVKIVSFQDFIESGNTTTYPPTPSKPGSCAVIMYTSGSTGKPKGVVVTHANLLGACAAGEIFLGLKNGEDVYLGYLPLAHILELMAEFSMLSQGCAICYACPKTLTSTGAYPIGALEQYSPTVMAAVPKIWEVIKKGVQAKIATASPVSQFLVNVAFEARMFAIKYGFDTPLFKALVFKKFSKVVGGRLRLAISGGGALNSEVQEFIRTCFGMPLIQGYVRCSETNGRKLYCQNLTKFSLYRV